MSANTAQRKSAWWLAITLLSQVVLMSFYAKNPESEQSMLRTWILSALTPVASWTQGAVSSVTGTLASYTDLRHAREENAELRQKLDELTAEYNKTRERAAELDLLRTQLALPTRPKYAELAANVVSRDASIWFRRLVIDRGQLDGVKRDMPVATATGIVGRIVSVGPNFSLVQVITDKHAGVGAMLGSSRQMGEVRGLDNARCELKNISATVEVQPGETVLTTGLDRIYPKGLVVGTVERIENDPNAPFARIIVNPSAPVDRVEHVMVLLVEQKDLKIEEGAK